MVRLISEGLEQKITFFYSKRTAHNIVGGSTLLGPPFSFVLLPTVHLYHLLVTRNCLLFLHLFESMVLRFLLQLESPNLDHQNSSYCILYLDYSNWHNIICT